MPSVAVIRTLAVAATAGLLLFGTQPDAPSAQSTPKPTDASVPSHDSAGRPYAHTVMAGAGTEWVEQAALDNGIKWMLANQHEDGRWGHVLPRRPADIMLGGLNSLHAFGNASTALAVMALMDLPKTPEIDASIHKGLKYLINAPEAKRVTGTVFYSMWSHMYVLQAVSQALGRPEYAELHEALRQRGEWELDHLLAQQMIDGGFGYYDFRYNNVRPSGDQTTSFGTAAVLIALHEARAAGFQVPQPVIDQALSVLRIMRVDNGAWVYSRDWRFRPVTGPSTVEGSLARAPACNLAMAIWEQPEGDIKLLQAGLDNLFVHHDYLEIARQRQYPHETWFANAPYYYYFGHFYAGRTLKLLSDSDRQVAAGRLAAFIGITADDDGSFWDYPLYGYTKAYGTAYGVALLNDCRMALKPRNGSATAER